MPQPVFTAIAKAKGESPFALQPSAFSTLRRLQANVGILRFAVSVALALFHDIEKLGSGDKAEDDQRILSLCFYTSMLFSLAVQAGCTDPIASVAPWCSDCCGGRSFGGEHAHTSGKMGWARIAVDWLSNSSQQVHLYNAGQPAVGAMDYLTCLHNWCPQEAAVDVFLFELSVTAPSSAHDFGSVESLLRWALSLPQQPAVIFVNFFSWCDELPSSDWRRCKHKTHGPSAKMQLRSNFSDSRGAIKHDLLLDLAKHYGVPVVSHKTSLYREIEHGQLVLEDITSEGVHPNVGGQWLTGNMLIYLLQAAMGTPAAQTPPQGPTPGEHEVQSTAERLPEHLYPNGGLHHEQFRKCYGFEHNEKAFAKRDGKNDPDRWRAYLTTGGMAWPSIPRMDGWRFEAVEEASNTIHKPGLLATVPGAVLEVELDTSLDPPLYTGQPFATIHYLSSFEHMGRVDITCRECECLQQQLDAHRTEDERSQMKDSRIHLSPSNGCIMRFTVANATSSGEHKWKLQRISIGYTMNISNSSEPPSAEHGN
ncbi:hypothetical protein CYMTET_52332 [Cymbomonas tetramitiformis]|uniref:Uncharacterized protein n=1 Tax=Cymbomonas tetramitiformis TaxID=36881 RepID=A0AAE0BJA4_9CHLO|nr:hypothetical protein CYMTET_52332 [Cymbomonas tetramitiformis]